MHLSRARRRRARHSGAGLFQAAATPPRGFWLRSRKASRSAAGRVGILDPYTELKPQKNKALGGPALEAHDLACVRGDRSLFSQLRFTLELGSALIVEGRNGSGKTSLLRIVCGLLRADHGEVRWRGELIHKVREEYYKDLAYIGHLNGLKAELTPLENLRITQTLAATTPRTTPEKALAHMELDPFSLLPCRDLSLGQRRRAA
ncbi:MAG: heme ABC exporter ATP-binding protein CcmA, partial [Gammaproteobacteria bacterium]